MKKTSANIFKVAAMVAATSLAGNAAAQNSSLYFMKWNPQQHTFNPAFQPQCKFYIGMPGLSNMSFEAGNNDFVFTDIFKNVTVDGKQKTVLFLDKDAPKGAKSDFLNAMGDGSRIFYDHRLNLVDFGFRIKGSNYITFGVANRAMVSTVLPKSIFQLALEGVDEGETFKFNGKHLGVDAMVFEEIALGYSMPIDDKLTVGGKLKFLYGNANAHSDFKNIKITGNEDRWAIEGDGEINFAVPGLEIKKDKKDRIDELEFNDDLEASDYTKAAGYGLAVDLGATYKFRDNITFSASVLDLGFINWKNNLQRIKKVGDFEFEGIEYDMDIDTINYRRKYKDMLEDMFTVDDKADAYKTSLYTKVQVGGEYSLWEDRLGLGLLYRGQLYRGHMYGNGVASVNFRPWRALSLGLTYDMFDGQWNNVGAGLNLNAGPVNLFALVDNIPAKFAKVNDNIPVPSNTSDFRFQMGLNYCFGFRNKKDKAAKADSVLAEQTVVADSVKAEPVVADTVKASEAQPAVDTVKTDTVAAPAPVEVKVADTVKAVVEEAKQVVVEEAKQVVEESAKPAVDDAKIIAEEVKKPLNTAELLQLQQVAVRNIKFIPTAEIMAIDPVSYPTLDKIANVLLADPALQAEIINHSSLVKDKRYTYFLTEEHASIIKGYLVDKGVEPSRLKTVGMGNDKPMKNNNNRTEIKFYK